VVVAPATKVLLATFLNDADSEVTIRRMRGLLTVQSDQVAAGEQQLGALGAGVFTATALVAGVASLPDPVTDVSDDSWMMFEHIGQQIVVGTNVGVEPSFATQYVIDSKAMRKLPVGYGIGFVIANSSAGNGMSVTLGVRLLSSLTGR
jgi:hypothetical protein